MSRSSSRFRLLAIALTTTFVLSLMTAGTVVAEPPDNPGPPDSVVTGSDNAKKKLHPKLQDIADEASPQGQVAVFAMVVGDTAPARALMQNAYATQRGDVSLVVGRIAGARLLKLAGLQNVVSVGPLEFEKTGQPLGVPDPELNQRPSKAALQARLASLQNDEVPYSEAPAPKGSNIEDLKELAVLDARTHNYVEAWEDGFTGAGVTVGVLDGGTDFGHPDLLNTWDVWPAMGDSAFTDDGWSGWPRAFDPFGTLIFLAAPSFVNQGLSWYVLTEEKTVAAQEGRGPGGDRGPGANRRGAIARVSFAVKTGPSRNFNAPAGTNTYEYTFPIEWARGGKVRMGSHPDDHLLALHGERVAFLVVNSAGGPAYDTVYVDLDNDKDFSDEKPITRESPASYRDMNGDGITDISGGLLYFISDGETKIPGGLTEFLGSSTPTPGPGEMLAWTGDYDPAIGGHGTLTASNVVGQGVINGMAPCFDDLAGADGAVPCDGGGTYPGANFGAAPDAKLAPFGDIYFSFDFSTQFGYYTSVFNGVDLTSNSYGASDVDNDGWDAASQEADLIHFFLGQGRTVPLFSTGNGAPGFGTTAPPSPFMGIGIGASTQFGATGWDSIANYSQVVDNDVMVWSNRGPGATGSAGVEVVADGAFSAGSVTLNAIMSGNDAWATWGGTSRSAPVAAGVTALIYQAWGAANGPIPAGFAVKAKEILMGSAMDLGYDTWIQGAGSVDAGAAVRVAQGDDGSVSPNSWRVGDYRGDHFSVFSHIIAPGESDSETFTINGPGTYQISDRYMVRTNSETISFTSSPLGNESSYKFNAPDYLIDITDMVNANAAADLMVVRANYDFSQFDTDANYTRNNEFRLLTYNWTDVNDNGGLWTDVDADGAVDHEELETSSNIDGFLDIDYANSEIEEGEYVRFMYHRAGANTLQNFIRDPAERMADGVFIGLQHFLRTDDVPTTDIEFQIDFYENTDWPWLTAPASASGSFEATINVPSETPYGMYDGAIVLTQDDHEIVVPVAVAVAPTLEADTEGNLPAVTFGGADVATAQDDMLYNNGSVFGASDWTWRAESGDWRFFFFDVDAEVGEGTLFLTDTTWDDAAPFTDIDTLVFGPSENHYQLFGGTTPFGGPYILDTVGSSPNTHRGSGIWSFDTATGGARDVVAAAVQEGLHAVVHHQVLFQGDKFHVPFETTLGTASVSPTEVEIDADEDTGSFEITFESSVELAGVAAEGFGLSQPVTSPETAQQDDPDDPSSASVKKDVTISHASSARFATDLAGHDVDLFVVYDENNDGNFTNDEIIGASTTPTGVEFVELIRPADGNYQVWVQGWSVTGTPSFNLTMDIVQGNDLTVSGLPAGAVPAGTPVTIMVDFSKTMTVGESYFGEILMGPSVAPSALRIPVTINRVDPAP